MGNSQAQRLYPTAKAGEAHLRKHQLTAPHRELLSIPLAPARAAKGQLRNPTCPLRQPQPDPGPAESMRPARISPYGRWASAGGGAGVAMRTRTLAFPLLGG